MATRAPRQARAKATRERILDAARAVVAGDGVEAMTPTRVADEAGVAIGTLYAYFEGADGLVDALVDEHLENLVELTRHAIDRDALVDAEAVVDELIDAFVGYYTSTPDFAEVWYGPAFAHRHDVANRAANDAMVQLSIDLLVQAGLVAEVTEEMRHELAVDWCIGEALLDAAVRSDPFDERYVTAAKETIKLRVARRGLPGVG